MVPIIMPFPVRVLVMVILFEPVSILPLVMLRIGTEILFNKVTVEVAADLFIVRILKVVTPPMVELLLPVNWTVLVEGVNVPLFTQLAKIVCVYEPPANVVNDEIVIVPLTVTFPAAIFVFPFERIRLL